MSQSKTFEEKFSLCAQEKQYASVIEEEQNHISQPAGREFTSNAALVFKGHDIEEEIFNEDGMPRGADQSMTWQSGKLNATE